MQNMSFFQTLKFGYDVTSNNVINFKINLFIPALKIDYDSKFGSSITFRSAVAQQRLFDTRWQTFKAEKGGSPMSKTWDFFLVA